MKNANISKPTLGRLPIYLEYIRTHISTEMTSAAEIARGLKLGEVQVRRDLNMICKEGRPKVGYPTKTLISDLEAALRQNECVPAVIVGAGKLGRALQGYDGFSEFGLDIVASFDIDKTKTGACSKTHPIYPMDRFAEFCRHYGIRVGIITAPREAAQEICDMMAACGITAVWNFAPCRLTVPENITVKNENLALSLAHLYVLASGQDNKKELHYERKKTRDRGQH